MDLSAEHFWTLNQTDAFLKNFTLCFMCGMALVTLFKRKQDQLKKCMSVNCVLLNYALNYQQIVHFTL